MNSRTLGNGLTVSSVGLGCMGLSHAYGAPTEEKEAIRILQNGYELGYTLFDTAECYGTADFPVLEELNVGLVAFSPMANGFLSGKYGKDAAFDKKLDYRSKMPQFAEDAIDKNQKLLTLLRTMGEEKNATPGQISLAWMLCKKPYIVPIPGTRKLERLKENAASAQVKLTPAEVQVLDEALDNMQLSAVFGGSNIKTSKGE